MKKIPSIFIMNVDRNKEFVSQMFGLLNIVRSGNIYISANTL